MRYPRWLVIAVLIAAGALVLWLIGRSGAERVVTDLVDELPNATQRRPHVDVFAVEDVTIAGEARRSIVVTEPSRLVYRVTVPAGGRLLVSIGLKEESWPIKGDGVLFRILLAAPDATELDELLSVVINPYANTSDRRWYDLRLDLGQYAGETVEIFLLTNASPPSPPGTPPRDDREGDLAVWGEPRIVTR